MFRYYACPMHYGVGARGLIKSIDYLCTHYPQIRPEIIPEITCAEENLPKLKNLNSVTATCASIAEHALQILEDGDFPVFIAGDHSSAMGSASASSAYYGQDTGLIWIDAHPDINTDGTSATGNIHGMPVAALLGRGCEQLQHFLNERPKIKPEHIVMLGLRDIDPPEAVTLKELGIRYYTYDDICRHGLLHCMEETCRYLSGCTHVHVSFDIDSMDPKLMPGVSVPVPGGFTPEDIHTITEVLFAGLPVCALDIVEFNAEKDRGQMTSDFVNSYLHFIKRFAKRRHAVPLQLRRTVSSGL